MSDEELPSTSREVHAEKEEVKRARQKKSVLYIFCLQTDVKNKTQKFVVYPRLEATEHGGKAVQFPSARLYVDIYCSCCMDSCLFRWRLAFACVTSAAGAKLLRFFFNKPTKELMQTSVTQHEQPAGAARR